MAEPTGEIPTTQQTEGTAVPKPPEVKPSEKPISPGAQRIIDRINQVRDPHGDPRQTLGDVAKEEVVIDMVEADGKWVARDPGDPNFFVTPKPENPAAAGAEPQAAEPNGQQRPRNRWREAEQRGQQKEAQKQQELQRLQADGARLAAFVYTPEGQQQIAAVRTRLTQIVEITLRKPKLETVSSFEHSQPAIAEVEQRNDQLLQAWQQSTEARIEELLRGENMNSVEADAYLASVLGHESHPMTGNDAENKKRRQLVEQFDRMRRDIGRALLYQSSEAKPVGQRHLLLAEATLRFHGITTSEAQENFAKGWEGVKAQSLQRNQGRPKP